MFVIGDVGVKLLTAVNDDRGFDSGLSEHFGHCPYFAIYETETKKFEIVENKLDHSNLDMTPVDQVMKFKPDVVFTLGMGGRAVKLFGEAGVKLKIGDYKIVREVVENVDNLKELDGGCEH